MTNETMYFSVQSCPLGNFVLKYFGLNDKNKQKINDFESICQFFHRQFDFMLIKMNDLFETAELSRFKSM